jgi:hypothetical protein
MSLRMYIFCSLLLHVSAAHGPPSGNIYYLGRQLNCTILVFCSYRRIVFIVVNFIYRIFLPYFLSRHFTLIYNIGIYQYDIIFKLFLYIYMLFLVLTCSFLVSNII